MAGRNIGHSDGSGRGRCKGSACDLPDRIASSIGHRHAAARGCTAFEPEAGAHALWPLRKLSKNTVCAAETSSGPPTLADREGQPGLDRRGCLIHVLTIEAEAGLEPERVARAKPDCKHLRLGEKAAGEAFGKRAADRNFEAVLACVARARDRKGLGAQQECSALHKAEPLRA